MNRIAYLIPYFGKLPSSFGLWLLSAGTNKDVSFIIITDDHTHYDYPDNITVFYTTWDNIKERISSFYDFDICLDRPWKLCEFKPAYGEIFSEELKGYEFWGHCDMDLIWGDINKFITDDILNKFDKIGIWGHSTLYRNTPEVNLRYRTIIDEVSYIEAFSNSKAMLLDEFGMIKIYEHLNIPYYSDNNFASLDMWTKSFFVGNLPAEEAYKNRRQVFVWKKGKLYRYYLDQNNCMQWEEFLYFHTFARPVKYKIDIYDENEMYIAYPDTIKRMKPEMLTPQFVKRKGTCSTFRYYLVMAYANRKRLTPKVIWNNIMKRIELHKTRGFS